jgi:hypothetical protein
LIANAELVLQLTDLYSPSAEPADGSTVALDTGAAVITGSDVSGATPDGALGAGATPGAGAATGAGGAAVSVVAAWTREIEPRKLKRTRRTMEFLIMNVNVMKINIQDVSYAVEILCQKKACRKEEFEYTIYTFVL